MNSFLCGFLYLTLQAAFLTTEDLQSHACYWVNYFCSLGQEGEKRGKGFQGILSP